ncbi:DUF1631 family protein [Ottowia testudinis]|uniref:DUF1631 domain-containing protein n=1 Tax=Ottowia testudinis TaxID=2816950 RepID=A0A975H3A3_9BURK|nr:DUF1631 family protein [Ottowia testudinis]QTD45619.1 DUF1631 domain-containing protein [Ottowia testudinis]
MVTPLTPPPTEHRIARQVRERFVDALDGLIIELMGRIQGQLAQLAQGGAKGTSLSEMQLALEASASFQRERQAWVAAVRQGWREALNAPRGAGGSLASQKASLGLVDDEIVERKIVASRMGSAVLEAAGAEFNNLRLRIQYLDRTSDLTPRDVLRPEVFAQQLIKAWTGCGLTRPMWALVHLPVQAEMVTRMVAAYQHANAALVEHGVMAEIDLKSLVRRTDGGAAVTGPGAPPEGAWGAAPRGQAGGRTPPAPAATRFDAPMTTASAYGAVADPPEVRASALARAAQETRMLTAATPMARVRQRAQGVLGQLRRLMSERVADFDGTTPPGPPSPQLARALTEVVTPFAVTELLDSRTGAATLPAASVDAVATRLRQRATELKTKADKPSEKAIIEIVALMFQAILAEERIPPTIRVWFARLQIPVLRLALAEPDFFASIEHPARQLIDRMGACALGFDATTITGSRLEREIKRIVQVIEQYPETGRRVYQLVLDEFKKFLGRSLTEGRSAHQMATLAQQVEQKEALAIQYTIELRRMLASLLVADEVREFLFRVWSEVLAMAAVRRGPQADETLRYKQAAADLLWAVSPKSDRAERSRVVQQLSGLLQALRAGMDTLALDPDEQDGHIKRINDAVTQAFVSRDDGLSAERLAELSRSLAGLEDVVTDDAEGDVLLDPGMIELMFGVEGDALEVIAEGGSQPSDGILRWAHELELGAWFALDFQGQVGQVQYVWRSQRGQLHLFSAGGGTSYLVQTRRMASYLQAGLLVPVEDEALTVRATREALGKLNAEPAQLLH